MYQDGNVILIEDNNMEYSFNGQYAWILKDLLYELGAIEELNIDCKSKYMISCDENWGEIEVAILLKDGRVFSYKYDYGHPDSIGEDWKDKGPIEIKKEMKEKATFFNNVNDYEKWFENSLRLNMTRR